MTELWEILSNNSFLGALFSGLLILFIGWFIKLGIIKYRKNKVYKVLQAGLEGKGKTFLPSSYLSANTGYTQSQIEQYCSSHSRIKRNEKELESWQVI